MVFQGSRLVSIVPGRFYGFSWFQVGFHSFLRLVFHDSRWVLRVIHGPRLVFIVPGRFFIVPRGFHGSRSNFHASRWIFIVIFGSRLVSFRRREVRL